MDPITIGLLMQGLGSGMNAFGNYQQGRARNRQQSLINQLAQGMMQGGPNSGTIDISSILAGMNPGNDALNQFLRSDPTRQMQAAAGGQFDASQAFDMLQGNDTMQINRAAEQARAGYAGLGQRFGGAAQEREGRMRSDFAAQIAARNAGIAQNAFESQAMRQLQGTQAGLGFQLGGAQSLAQMGGIGAQIAAQLAQSNQGQNQNLLAIMAGLQPGGGGGAQALGQGFGDIGQLMAFLPMLQQLANRGQSTQAMPPMQTPIPNYSNFPRYF